MPLRLDERLTAIAEQAAGVRTVCDVGSDHGKLACWLVQTGRAERAVATDISAPSLKKAERLAEELGLADLVETRTGDGLDPVADREADAVVIAGMGGDLVAGILERAHAQGKRFARFVLSPNTHPERVRGVVADVGHRIVRDFSAECAGKKYTVIVTEEGEGEPLSAAELRFGRFFRTDKDFVLSAEKELDALAAELALNPAALKLAERAAALREALEECER